MTEKYGQARRLPDGTHIRVRSEQFDERCEGLIIDAEFDDGWLYRIEVTAGDCMDAHRDGDGSLWLNDFEVQTVGDRR